MKHILQWKIIGIMFFSMFCGVAAMSFAQYIVFGIGMGMTPEESEIAFANYSYLFDLLFVLVTIITFWLLSRRIVRRIEIMNQNVEQISNGNMTALSADYKQDELGNLSCHIKEMADKISDSLEKEKMMICQVAHDLRTPVTSIQGYAQLLNKSKELSDEDRKCAVIIDKKSQDLSEQIEELLEYSVLQFEEKEYLFEEISIKRLLEQVFIEFVPMLEQKQMTFSMKGNQKELLFPCNQILMVRLFENLLNNSVRYGKNGGTIEAQLAEDDEKIQIAISNEGSGLSKDETEHLFEAFYQGKDAKEYQTKSKGLGLAIAKRIVLLHGGNIKVDCKDKEKRVIFVIEFPK